MWPLFSNSLLFSGFIASTYASSLHAEHYRVRGLDAYGAQGTLIHLCTLLHTFASCWLLYSIEEMYAGYMPLLLEEEQSRDKNGRRGGSEGGKKEEDDEGSYFFWLVKQRQRPRPTSPPTASFPPATKATTHNSSTRSLAGSTTSVSHADEGERLVVWLNGGPGESAPFLPF